MPVYSDFLIRKDVLGIVPITNTITNQKKFEF